MLNGLKIKTIKEEMTQGDKVGNKLKIQLVDIDDTVIGGFVIDSFNSRMIPNENLAEHVALFLKRVFSNYLLEAIKNYSQSLKAKENIDEPEKVS